MEKPQIIFDLSMCDKEEVEVYNSLSEKDKKSFEAMIVKRYKENQKLEELNRKLKAKKSKIMEEKRRKDAHNKIVLGGAVLSVLGRDYKDGDENKLIAFLKSQNERGNYFNDAMR